VLRFVILEHDWPEPHFDLFLEAGEALQAWKLPALFSPDFSDTVIRSASHRRHYLDYEGAVSGGRGVVRRWDSGEFAWLVEDPDLLRACFFGQLLTGTYEWRKGEVGGWTFRRVT